MHGPAFVASVPGFNKSRGARTGRSKWTSCEVIWSLSVSFTVPAASTLSCEAAAEVFMLSSSLQDVRLQ